MCGTCGCSDPANEISMTDPATGERRVLRTSAVSVPHAHAHDHSHDHTQDHAHGRSHGHEHHHHSHDHGEEHTHAHVHAHDGEPPHVHGPGGEMITLETAVLAKNDQVAARNRGWFEGRGVLAINLVSSPGAGKTTLLERTIRELGDAMDIAVIEGDQMTVNDADRIRAAGARAIQINTGAGCHLEADMVANAVEQLDPAPGSVLMIENVGNLVCPAMFDLGEHMKVAVISTPEGEDKPLKYPHMFRAAGVVLINKIDIAQYVDFDEDRCRAHIRQVNPEARVLSLSAKTGDGMGTWLGWIREHAAGPA